MRMDYTAVSEEKIRCLYSYLSAIVSHVLSSRVTSAVSRRSARAPAITELACEAMAEGADAVPSAAAQ